MERDYLYISRRFHMIMRRTTPVEPSEPSNLCRLTISEGRFPESADGAEVRSRERRRIHRRPF